jgi:hypothetical protein
MNIKEQAAQLNKAIEEAESDICDIIRQEGCGYKPWAHCILSKGIVIDFPFRGETDYTLIIPWDYVQDPDKIREYYKRFLIAIRPIHYIGGIQERSDEFYYNEMSKLSTPSV